MVFFVCMVQERIARAFLICYFFGERNGKREIIGIMGRKNVMGVRKLGLPLEAPVSMMTISFDSLILGRCVSELVCLSVCVW